MFESPRIIIHDKDTSLGAEFPEVVLWHDGGPLPCRYEVTRRGEVFVRAIKVGDVWHDPVNFGVLESTMAVWATECLAIERDLVASS